MRGTTYKVIKDVLNDWGVPYDEDKTHHIIKVGNNELSYLALDDPEKIKGGEFADVWLEEANEFDEADYNQLKIRLNRTDEDSVIYLSFNPVDKDHWVIKKVVHRASVDKRIFVHHSTYKDNLRFLSNAFIEELESYIDVDENFYRIYTLGLPGILRGQIYKNWKFEDADDWPQAVYSGKHMYGIDFGFNAPMAVVEIYVYDEEYYIRELVYERGLTTNDLLSRFESMDLDKMADMYCDSAEPDRIQELRNAGYNSRSSKKDVRAGIDYVKGRKIHVDETCSPNLYTEYNNYKWKEDKDGSQLDEPVKAYDHLLDAIRYGIFSSIGEEYKSIGGIGNFNF
jgi:phage terminase large subunit